MKTRLLDCKMQISLGHSMDKRMCIDMPVVLMLLYAQAAAGPE